MRKVFLFHISLIMFCGSCKPATESVSVAELAIINYKYYNKQSHKLFTGIAVTKFPSGSISSLTEIKDGIPNGNWFDYGYKGELIHEGKYVPLQLDEIKTEENIERLNISSWKEAAFLFIDIFIVEKKTSNKRFDTTKLKKRIEYVLQQKNIISNADSINEVKIVKGDLE